MPLKIRRIVTAAVLTIAVGLVAAPGASAGIPNPFYQYTYKKLVSLKCSVDPNSAVEKIRTTVNMRMGTFAHKSNNLRSMSLQVRMIPADSGNINYYYKWGKTKKDSVVNKDGDNNKAISARTPSEMPGEDYHVQVKMKWDRFATADWTIKERYNLAENFCSGGTFPAGRPTAGL